ncbi:hypothetical protein Fuma_00720 [Fuerstiella marisgermanici]|uniref:Uncharacterized protein n=1 Tax=Fuerstiella marisgermanici TaxID=1891926 RepID=A0A1P8WAS4_9PLAN|nr:hypothetical protein Fuma_00720 [Fuerstiella marisgermanici]
MLVPLVTRSVSEGSSCDESLAYASGYPKHGRMTKGGAVQLSHQPNHTDDDTFNHDITGFAKNRFHA